MSDNDLRIQKYHEKPCSVYFLRDPITQEIRYVGVSIEPQRRCTSHSRPCATSQSHKDRWIRSLTCSPIFEIVCWTSVEFAKELEIRLIAKLPNLTNETGGGDGLFNPSEDLRKRRGQAISKALTGKPWSGTKKASFTDEARKTKNELVSLGMAKMTDEAKEKRNNSISLALARKREAGWTGKKGSQHKVRSKPWSDERRKKYSGKPRSPRSSGMTEEERTKLNLAISENWL